MTFRNHIPVMTDPSYQRPAGERQGVGTIIWKWALVPVNHDTFFQCITVHSIIPIIRNKSHPNPTYPSRTNYRLSYRFMGLNLPNYVYDSLMLNFGTLFLMPWFIELKKFKKQLKSHLFSNKLELTGLLFLCIYFVDLSNYHSTVITFDLFCSLLCILRSQRT